MPWVTRVRLIIVQTWIIFLIAASRSEINIIKWQRLKRPHSPLRRYDIMFYIISTHLNVCLFTATDNFKWVEIAGFTSRPYRPLAYVPLHLVFGCFDLGPSHQAWGEYWTKVFEYKYKYLKKWRIQVQVQVLDFQKYLSTSTSTLKSTWVQVPSTLVVNSN